MPTDQQRRGLAAVVETHPATAAVLVSLLVALAVVSPFAWRGNPAGHDLDFHLHSWIDAGHSWQEGVLFPRWAELANHGYGEPRFVFYPPLSWMLGAALSLVLPWKMVPGGYCVLVLTLAGAAMFRLARRYLPVTDAAVAAALYVANPYHLLLVYFRSAFAELLVSALFPLLVCCALSLPRDRWRAAAPLALVVGAIWLTNAPAALMTSYALALLLVLVAWAERSAKPLGAGGAAIALGLALAAVYIIPAAVEQPWVWIRAAVASGLAPAQNFLYTRGIDDLRTAFNTLVSSIGLLQIGVFALVLWNARKERGRFARAWWPLVALGAVSALLMFRLTAPLWRIVPKAEFIQFPWRWLLVLSCCVALIGTAGYMPKRFKRAEWVFTGVLLLLLAQFLVDHASWHPGGADEGLARSLDGGYAGSDEYAPITAPRHSDLKPDAPLARILDQDGNVAETDVKVEEWAPEEKRVLVTSHGRQRLVLRLVNYPAWRAAVNGAVVETASRAGTGEIVVPLAIGRNRVELRFAHTWDRLLGGAVSAIGLAILAGLFFLGRKAGP